jgi:hypothetical protein
MADMGREKNSVYSLMPDFGRLRDIVSRLTPVNKYNRVSRCQMISSVECMRILHKLVYKVWPNFSL